MVRRPGAESSFRSIYIIYFVLSCPLGLRVMGFRPGQQVSERNRYRSAAERYPFRFCNSNITLVGMPATLFPLPSPARPGILELKCPKPLVRFLQSRQYMFPTREVSCRRSYPLIMLNLEIGADSVSALHSGRGIFLPVILGISRQIDGTSLRFVSQCRQSSLIRCLETLHHALQDRFGEQWRDGVAVLLPDLGDAEPNGPVVSWWEGL